jgi:CheY-like chemotaxis protein
MRDEHQPIVILLADDDEEDRMLTCDALAESHLSNDIHCVTDGEDLMDYLHRRGKYTTPGAAPRPGLILLDLNMPKKDGREALQEIKSDLELQKIPVVVMTTSKDDEDLYSSYDSGASSFIRKPVTFNGLVDLMKGLGRFWFGKAREMKNETIKVLLIEDDEEDYILTRGLLSEEGTSSYVLDWASSYEEGLQVAGRGEHQVCLVDYRLGERTGVQLIREARESRLTTPMILLTGQGNHEVDVEAMQAGATGYLVKEETHSEHLKRTIRYAVELNNERCRVEEKLAERK